MLLPKDRAALVPQIVLKEKFMATYSNQVFQYIQKIADQITYAANSEGVSAGAIAGGMAKENNSWIKYEVAKFPPLKDTESPRVS